MCVLDQWTVQRGENFSAGRHSDFSLTSKAKTEYELRKKEEKKDSHTFDRISQHEITASITQR